MVGESLVSAGLLTKTGTPFVGGLIKLVGKNLVSGDASGIVPATTANMLL
jgi:hypothetical protein